MIEQPQVIHHVETQYTTAPQQQQDIVGKDLPIQQEMSGKVAAILSQYPPPPVATTDTKKA